ncbi:Txe/YoeB family addiction module toxin [Streptomyces sp. NPDC096136]|uniref:Txe/YoeB family addiction module toxin n=1 Tax=Streptomyces sp. NPDC096136 TaxID=3366076 RepID=UPI0038113858
MKVLIPGRAWEQYTYWATAGPKVLKRINRLIEEIQRTPFEGAGKPEPLKENLSGWWSRRITDEHRLVYRIRDGAVEVAQARYPY